MLRAVSQIAAFSFVAAAFSLAVAALTLRHRSERHAPSFLALVSVIGAWSFATGIQLTQQTAAAQLPWFRVSQTFAGLVPLTWLVFTARYAGRGEWFTRRRLALFALHPATFVVLTLTNGRHGLFWHAEGFVPAVPVVDIELLWPYYLHLAISYGMVVAGLWLIISVAEGSRSLYQRQVELLVAGTIPPLVANVLFALEAGPIPALDMTPLAFSITAVAFGLALFHFDVLERTPVARRQAIDRTGDGLLVTDADGAVVDANETARAVLNPPPDPGVDLRANHPELGIGGPGAETIQATVDGTTRSYDVRAAPIEDARGTDAGQVVLLRDVTDRRAYEQRLEVTNRVLRHNLRNDLNVVLGRAQQLAEKYPEDDAVRTIEETADGLLELGDEARLMSRAADPGAELVSVDVVPIVTSVLGRFREEAPHVSFDADVPDGAVVRAPDEEFLERAVAELVENSVEHGDDGSLTVTVAVSRSEGAVTIDVVDDGVGVPDVERSVYNSGSETQLEHGSGLGLWIAYWCAESAGGSFELRERDGGGTRACLRLPAARSVAV